MSTKCGQRLLAQRMSKKGKEKMICTLKLEL